MIKKDIKEPTTPPRFDLPPVIQKSMNTSAIHLAVQKRCGGCGQILVDENCPDCGKVVTL